MLGAQVVVCLGVFKTIRPTGIMAGRIHVAPALITRSGPFFIRCGSGAANLLSLYTCDITTGEIRTWGWRRWWRRRSVKKPVDAGRSTRAWPSYLVPTLHSTTSLTHFQDSMKTLVFIQLSLFLYASVANNPEFLSGLLEFLVATKPKNFKQKKDTFRIWRGQLETQVFFHKLVLKKKKKMNPHLRYSRSG